MSNRSVHHPLSTDLHPIQGTQAVKVRRLVLGTELEAAAHRTLLLRLVRADVDAHTADVKHELRIDRVRIPLAVLPRGLTGVVAPLGSESLTRCRHDLTGGRDSLRANLGKI